MSLSLDVPAPAAENPFAPFMQRLVSAVHATAQARAERESVYHKAFAVWIGNVQEHLERDAEELSFAPIRAEVVERAIIEVEIHRLDAIAAGLRESFHGNALKLATVAARQAAEYHVDIPGNVTWELDSIRGAIVTKTAFRESNPEAVKAAVRLLLEADEEARKGFITEGLPAPVREAACTNSPEEFFTDLIELLEELTEPERGVVSQMLTDAGLAERIKAREWAPAPLRHLAGLCLA